MTNAVYPHPVRTEWKMLAQCRIDTPDVSVPDIAKALGRNAQTVRMWLRDPLYQAYETWCVHKTFDDMPLVEKMGRAAMKDNIDVFAEEMLLRLRDIVETTHDEGLVAKIGFDALDRAGYTEPKRDATRSINFILTPEALRILQQRSAEMNGSTALIDGEVVKSEVA